LLVKGHIAKSWSKFVFEEGIPNVQILGYVDDTTKKQLFAEQIYFVRQQCLVKFWHCVA